MTQAPQGTATAPEIPGYTYVRPIGHGGFSDVYLYEQTMPRRQVAIKVLRTEDLSSGVREQFAAEANLMARVSHHSNIAPIFAADVDDDGQPYLVMEYCSGGSLGAFYRHYPMSVKNVLSLGIRLAGALEAAHRAGIVHRDIKPANILLTEYGVPVLSDFGISTIDEGFPEATRAQRTGGRPGTGESSIGMSLPWAAPETLWEEPVSDARSDRYSFAATLYSLLEGRSPHEVPGGPNNAAHLTGRIQGGFVAAMKRTDVPPSLQAILRRGLSHDRGSRYDSAADMGRALQDVQRELGFEVTPLEVPRGGELANRPPEVTTQVQQPQPIRLPEGHATLAPPDAPPSGVGASGVGPSSRATGWGTAAAASSWSAPRSPWDPPHVSAAAPSAAPAPVVMAGVPATARSATPWRLLIGILIGILVLACVVVASLLIARANSEPTYEGRAVDNLQVQLTDRGVYEVTVPEALDMPADLQVRPLATGTGDVVTSAADISVDSAQWVDGATVALNPMESENLGRSSYVSADQLAALGIDVQTLREGDILLVAAPVGKLANQHPELGVNYSDGTLMIMQIIDAY